LVLRLLVLLVRMVQMELKAAQKRQLQVLQQTVEVAPQLVVLQELERPEQLERQGYPAQLATQGTAFLLPESHVCAPSRFPGC